MSSATRELRRSRRPEGSDAPAGRLPVEVKHLGVGTMVTRHDVVGPAWRRLTVTRTPCRSSGLHAASMS